MRSATIPATIFALIRAHRASGHPDDLAPVWEKACGPCPDYESDEARR